jgi:drug/metabolite transporter (DMT)-like permease
MKWLLVALVVTATAGADLLQSWAGKRQGEVSSAADLGRLLAKWPILAAIACMAVSFFSFLALLKIADLSFAVPATAATVVIETVLARFALGERVEARRWGGSLLVTIGIALLAQS